MIVKEGFYVALNDPREQPSLGQQLKTYRLHNQVTQDQLAKRMGVSQQYINGIEQGKKRLFVDIVTKYLACLGCIVELTGMDITAQQHALAAIGIKKTLHAPSTKGLIVNGKG
jgi:transcriptional regulator with XRE-family HTH domain